MSGWRLPRGGRIDRARPVRFSWAGRRLTGFGGDTLASALLANGVAVVGRSFKYHRPRGIMAAGLEESNALVQLGSGARAVPNVKATQVELREGDEAVPVNACPSTRFDLLAINDRLYRFLAAGFYYKTFLWPGWGWFEPAIRRAAGLGTVPAGPDPDRYEHRNAHVDVLVVGAGPSGLAAALAASRDGSDVMLVDSDFEAGGSLIGHQGMVQGEGAEEWTRRTVAALAARPNVTILPRTTAFGYYDHDLVGLCEYLPPGAESFRQRIWRVRAARVVLATGAFERPLQFVGNDLPGVMLAGAAMTYARRFAVAPGRRAVVATNNDSAYEAAFALHDSGVDIAAILDSRNEPGAAAGEARARSIPVVTAAVPVAARGRNAVRLVEVAGVDGDGDTRRLQCDCLLVSGGWNPVVHLHSQAGGRLGYSEPLRTFLPADAPQGSITVGAAAGIFDTSAAIIAARAALDGGEIGGPQAAPLGPILQYADGDPRAHRAWLDFQNDVTVGDVQLAVRENYRSVEHVKRYTTLGMAVDQGKTSNVAAIDVLGGLLDRPAGRVGTTKFRPPFDPVAIGAFAGWSVGEDLMPSSRMAADAAMRELGGRMEQYGSWLRPASFARPGEAEEQAVAREVLAVRRGAGLFESSPLGKIEVRGPDAAAFLDRMYVNRLSNLAVGSCRYALMLSEHGVVQDDGVIARIGEDHFLVGTTSGHAGAVARGFEEWLQCEWPELRVVTENVTTGWAVMNVAGPRARSVLERLGTGINLAPGAFPHMRIREGTVGGVSARVQRVSFSGELSYEIAVPWRRGAQLWEALLRAGGEDGLVPFGVEALMAMRIEKGYLHVGVDTDGTTLPQDLGFETVIAKKPGDFVGRRSTVRPDGLRQDRRQLVGLEVADGGGALVAGAHILPPAGQRGSDGWVTSAVLSPTLQRPIALALVTRGRARIGEEVEVWDRGARRRGRIAPPCFYDPDGERLRG